MKTIEDKWLEVRSFYERTYKVTFKDRLPDDKIEFLWAEMNKLSDSIRSHFLKAQDALNRMNSIH